MPWNTPLMLTSTTRFQLATGVSHRYPNCSTPALLTSNRTGPMSRYVRSASAVTGVWVPHVARCRHSLTTRRAELLGQRVGCVAVDVGDDHGHAQCTGVAGQSGADSGTGAGDDGDAATKDIACGHVVKNSPLERCS